MPGTASYTEDGALAYALAAAAALHLHSVVSVVAATFFYGDIIVIAAIVVVVLVVLVVINTCAQNFIRTVGLRLHLGLQEQQHEII